MMRKQNATLKRSFHAIDGPHAEGWMLSPRAVHTFATTKVTCESLANPTQVVYALRHDEDPRPQMIYG